MRLRTSASSLPSPSPSSCLDRLQLLAQVVLPLRVGHLLLRLRLDLALHLEQRDLAREGVGDRLQLLEQVVLFEQRLLVGRLHVDERREHVGEPQRIVDVHDDRAQLLGEARGQRQRLLDQILDAADVRLDFDRPLERLRHRRDLRAHRRAGARDDVGADARDALDDDVDAAAGLGHLADDADGADAAQVVRVRVVGLALLQQQEHEAVVAQRAVDRLDRDRPVDRQRLQCQRKRDGAAKREDGKLGRKCGRRRFGHWPTAASVLETAL